MFIVYSAFERTFRVVLLKTERRIKIRPRERRTYSLERHGSRFADGQTIYTSERLIADGIHEDSKTETQAVDT